MTQNNSVRTYGHWINGEEISSDISFTERYCPGDGKLVARFASGTKKNVETAIDYAQKVFKSHTWSNTSGMQRAKVLNIWADLISENVENLARIEAQESGKPIRFARDEVNWAAEITRFAASLAYTKHGDSITDLGGNALGIVAHEPVGVVGMITPWNFPIVTLFQKLPFALAAGCSTVIKPSEMTAGTALETAKLAKKAGIPDGVINIITGSGKEVGEAILNDTRIRVVSFTGSTAVGKHIGSVVGNRLGRVSLELGGKGANIVFADADFEAAIDGVLFGAVLNQGEECAAGARLIIEKSIVDKFVTELSSRMQKVRIRHPLDEEGDIGALIHEGHMNSVLHYINKASEEGATIVTGGKRFTEDNFGDGFFVENTLITGVTPEMTVFKEEIFGPVLTVTTFDTMEEAISLANNTEYGLANGVWTKNIDKLHLVARQLRSGTVYANTYLDTSPQMPFGGFKNSGIGREMGLRALDEFTELKSTFIRLGDRTMTLGHTK